MKVLENSLETVSGGWLIRSAGGGGGNGRGYGTSAIRRRNRNRNRSGKAGKIARHIASEVKKGTTMQVSLSSRSGVEVRLDSVQKCLHCH